MEVVIEDRARDESDDWLMTELLDVEDVLAASLLVRSWGFPREVTEREIVDGFWFMMGPKVIWWYDPVPGFPEDWAIHGAVAQEIRGHWPVARWVRNLTAMGELIGAKRLRSLSEGEIPDFMATIGFVEDPVIGQVFDLRQTPRYGRRD